MTRLRPREGLRGGKELRILSCSCSSGLWCPFELAHLGRGGVGTTETSWPQRSLMGLWGLGGSSLGLEGSFFLLSRGRWSSPPLTPAPISAPFSCLSLQICFLCLLMAFLLPQNLPRIWSWLWPDSSLRILSFLLPVCLVHIGSHLHPGPISCGQRSLWDHLGLELRSVCLLSPLHPSAEMLELVVGGAWCAGVL